MSLLRYTIRFQVDSSKDFTRETKIRYEIIFQVYGRYEFERRDSPSGETSIVQPAHC